MWVEAKTQNEFDLHNIGSPKLPKEGNFARNGNFSYENTKLIPPGEGCITTYNVVFVKDRRDRKYAISGKSCGLWAAEGGHYARVMSKKSRSHDSQLVSLISAKRRSLKPNAI